MLPSHLLSEAAVETLKDPSKDLPALQYGDDAGYGPLRKEIASWISNVDGRAHLPEHICVTAGASLGMASILQSFTDPSITRAVWIVAPAYHLSFGMFKDAGFEDRLISVPEETDGIDLEWLEIQLAKCDEDYSQPYLSTRKPGPGRKFYRHVIYTVPTCANPSGRTTSLTTRSRLVALARKHVARCVRPGLQRRHAVLARAVGAHLAPFGVSWVRRDDDGVLGGYFLWLTLPVGSPSATEFAARAEAEEGVLVVPGDLFGVPGCGAGDLYQRSVRLSFAWEDDETFEEAVRGLANVLRKSLTKDYKKNSGLF
ncbi:hypothetical protein VD0004_g5492 [Verticillium dahliae]|uniref:Aminotransferase class I/classII large domain-containing protein n=1 Tax=Verticillium dahliae TaxID=27337 RepID=A0A444RKX9_VERDA|nr:hypothetical protein VD0004_g5492 [Verticillium dahliae]PNH73706.1 hypothetical protein VD0001_g3847 [Verticillium dahliae]RXG41764.1 hypothetical protein VDGE_30694 [Verticillium dahliae]